MRLLGGSHMVKILFVCHGNICRSPMAEFIFKDLIKKEGLEDKFEVSSLALSDEESGNDIYYLAKEELDKHHIPYTKRKARRFTLNDYDYYDQIYIMDESNKRLINRIVQDRDGKIKMLNGIIADPWYSGDFDTAFKQIKEGCLNILKENI